MWYSNLQCVFTFTLKSIGVDRGRRKFAVVEIIVNEISRALAVDKDDSADSGIGDQQVAECIAFFRLSSEDNLS